MADEPSDARAQQAAEWLPAQVAAALRGISDVARALTTAGTLSEVAERALAAMRVTLALEAAVLYLPDVSGRPLLRRFIAVPQQPPHAAHAHIDFDHAAWQLAVAGGHPLLFNEPAGWLVANPFEPPASHWLVVPLATAEHLAGAVVAVPGRPLELDAVSATVLSLLGEQLSAGIVNAQLRQQLEQAAIERERVRVAAEVHDGLAQNLALATRELAFLQSSPAAPEAAASQQRLRAAVADAHAVVRTRLLDLSASMPPGGLCRAAEDVCNRFQRRGLPVSLDIQPPDVDVGPALTAGVIRVLTEALANAAKHADASRVHVRIGAEAGALRVSILDDGRGFDPQHAGDRTDGQLGLALMRERVAEATGRVEIASAPGQGTAIRASFPLAPHSSD